LSVFPAESVPTKRQTKPTQQTEIEQEVRPDDDEAAAMVWMSKSSPFLFNLFALVKRENWADLQAREDGKPLKQNTGSPVARGKLQSVHVVRNIRCFKIEIMHIDCHTVWIDPCGRKHNISTLWVPTMTDRGLIHVQVPQLKKVKTTLFLHYSDNYLVNMPLLTWLNFVSE
jgi:hypothetical protein